MGASHGNPLGRILGQQRLDLIRRQPIPRLDGMFAGHLDKGASLKIRRPHAALAFQIRQRLPKEVSSIRPFSHKGRDCQDPHGKGAKLLELESQLLKGS